MQQKLAIEPVQSDDMVPTHRLLNKTHFLIYQLIYIYCIKLLVWYGQKVQFLRTCKHFDVFCTFN